MPPGYYHFCTDGWKNGRLFNSRSQFVIGMATIAFLSILFGVEIYAFELMPNHIHIILKATGSQCVDIFFYLTRRINRQLSEDGNPLLPEDYWFKLIPIEDRESMRHHIVYVARNPYEKGYSVPGAYMWGSGYLAFSHVSQFIRGPKVKDMKKKEIQKFTATREELPSTWEIHPEAGVLPANFVKVEKIRGMFSSPKDYMTMMVKDYEAFVRLSDSLGEELEFSLEEIKDIVGKSIRKDYPGSKLNSLSNEQKCRTAVQLNARYNISPKQLAQCLYMPERIVVQAINSKDYGNNSVRKSGSNP